MAGEITISQLLSQTDNTDRTSSYTSNTITPTTGKLVIVAIMYGTGTNNASPATLTGLGCTWTKLQTQVYNNRGVQLWWGIPTEASGTLVAAGFVGTFSTMTWSITEFNNTHPSSPVVQSNKAFINGSNTTGGVTLSAFEKTENATFGAIMRKGGAISGVGSGFSSIYNGSNDAGTFNSEWKNSNDTSVDWSWANDAGGESNMVACEIRQYQDLGGGSPMLFGGGVTIG